MKFRKRQDILIETLWQIYSLFTFSLLIQKDNVYNQFCLEILLIHNISYHNVHVYQGLK